MRASWALVGVVALVVQLTGVQTRPGRGPVDLVRQSTDVAWLERLATSAAFAEEVQRTSPIGMAKSLRVAAYARLGEIATPDSLAAVERIDNALAETPLTPSIVHLGVWPSVGWHMSDSETTPLARADGPDGTTYAVVVATLLGGFDFFLITHAQGDAPDSWSRPKLIAPAPRGGDLHDTTLTVRSPRTIVLRASGAERQIALDEIERDSDGDGWTDVEEARLGTNPHAADTDGDGIPDGRDVCPLYPAPSAGKADPNAAILQKAIFAAFALTGSRQLLYVTPHTPRVHVSGYGGPILFDRAVPRGGSDGGVYVSWKIGDKTDTDAIVQITDWEGLLAAGGQDVYLKKISGKWVVVSVKSSWIS